MGIIEIMAEEKIKACLKSGVFDNLPGKGKPLVLEDLSAVPKELRAGYKMLKNAGMLPEELQLRKDIVTLNDLLRCCEDDKERERLSKQLRLKRLKFNQIMEKRSIAHTSVFQSYRSRIFNRLHL
ncbi:DnaJ family domain-containing protein [Sporolactobacillus laevolacticus]|uniref:Molecular chaperone DnaJ n=1 Tax=Sporolactobacillus laevolacticus DSM 442 TaxID=1395513 RepID=V6IW89_9BACL|nr:DnaJ family domain-containing protein [Sporolactobacillus laevolacticus]EST11455.1 molecular chaperone DnaJ [Sporolactobacillus laevolacticus DSM 442]